MEMREYFHIPILPLDLLLFSQIKIALPVGEEDYKDSDDRCLENDEELGIVLFDKEGMREAG